MAQEQDKGAGVVVSGVGGTLLGTVLGLLLAGKPVEAAPAKEQWDYFIKCQEAIIALLQQILDAQGAVEVTVTTPWTAKEPEQIFNQAIRSVGAFNTDRMVDCTNIKRTLFKIESSLDQAVIIQLVGNVPDSFFLATNVGPALPCIANGNISVGLAWDDWHPFVGIRITTAVAPTTGILKVWVVNQE